VNVEVLALKEKQQKERAKRSRKYFEARKFQRKKKKETMQSNAQRCHSVSIYCIDSVIFKLGNFIV